MDQRSKRTRKKETVTSMANGLMELQTVGFSEHLSTRGAHAQHPRPRVPPTVLVVQASTKSSSHEEEVR